MKPPHQREAERKELFKPHRTIRSGGESWYYVGRQHVDVVHRVTDAAGAFLRTEQVRIGSRKLFRLLKLALTKTTGGRKGAR